MMFILGLKSRKAINNKHLKLTIRCWLFLRFSGLINFLIFSIINV